MKEYDIPKELSNIWIKAHSHFELKKMYIKIPFGFKKAVKLTESGELKNNEFWTKVFKLYPELKNKPVRFNSYRSTVSEIEEQEE